MSEDLIKTTDSVPENSGMDSLIDSVPENSEMDSFLESEGSELY